MTFRSHCEHFWGRPVAEFLCRFCSSLGFDLGVGAIDLTKWTWVFEIGDTDTEAVHAHWNDKLFRWKIKNSQQISHMRGSCFWVKSMLWQYQNGRILKIGQHLPKLWTNNIVGIFWPTVYKCLRSGFTTDDIFIYIIHSADNVCNRLNECLLFI